MFSSKIVSVVLACSFLPVAPLWSADSLAEGLVAHWPLNKLAGEKVKDLGPKRRDAMAEDVTLVEGRDGRVMAFDGKKSEMRPPDEPEFEIKGDYGVSFWVKVEPGSENSGPIYSQPGFSIKNFKGGIRVTFQHPDYSKTGYVDLMGPKINDGSWHHVVFTLKGRTGAGELFVDAQEAGAGSFPHRLEEAGVTTVGFDGRLHFQGELSDLRVYSRALDSGDVADLNNAKLEP
jgi:hypothetical protein